MRLLETGQVRGRDHHLTVLISTSSRLSRSAVSARGRVSAKIAMCRFADAAPGVVDLTGNEPQERGQDGVHGVRYGPCRRSALRARPPGSWWRRSVVRVARSTSGRGPRPRRRPRGVRRGPTSAATPALPHARRSPCARARRSGWRRGRALGSVIGAEVRAPRSRTSRLGGRSSTRCSNSRTISEHSVPSRVSDGSDRAVVQASVVLPCSWCRRTRAAR
jgi:hypothetical protein